MAAMRNALRGVVFEIDTRGVEVLTAQLSIWFAGVLLTSDSAYRPQPVWLWSLWCGVAAVAKLLGVGASFDTLPPAWARWARGVGCGLGAIFWVVLTTVLYILAGGGLVWGSFGIIATAQAWCVWRLWRGR